MNTKAFIIDRSEVFMHIVDNEFDYPSGDPDVCHY